MVYDVFEALFVAVVVPVRVFDSLLCVDQLKPSVGCQLSISVIVDPL